MKGCALFGQAVITPRVSVVIGACLTQFTIIGMLFSYGLIFTVLEDEFGWSRTVLSICMSLTVIVMGVLSILGGRLSDRFGPRLVLGTTGLIYGIGYLLMARVTEPWQLVLIFGLFVGIGMSTHDVVTLSTVARWYQARRGLMTAVVKLGTALGQMMVPPLVAVLIIQTDWRTALVIMGCAAGVVLVFAASLTRSPGAGHSTAAANAVGMTFAEARATRVFWSICAIQFLYFPVMITIPLHIAVHGTDLGMSQDEAAILLSVVGGSSIIGRFAIGAVIDRIGARASYMICLAGLVISLMAFTMITSTDVLYAAVFVYGFSHGGCFIIVSPTIARYFGTKAHGAIFGMVLFFGTIGGAVGPVLTGRIFDVTGSYDLAFQILAASVSVALVIVFTLQRPTLAEAAPSTA